MLVVSIFRINFKQWFDYIHVLTLDFNADIYLVRLGILFLFFLPVLSVFGGMIYSDT